MHEYARYDELSFCGEHIVLKRFSGHNIVFFALPMIRHNMLNWSH